jgi:pyruvate,water dikinase
MDPGLTPLTLAEVSDEAVFGGKAVSLGAAVRAGLPVPPGIALSARLVDRIASGSHDAVTAVRSSVELPRGRMAVRSSAIGEDSSGASFAGQHVTRLNVFEPDIPAAVRLVWESARSEAALAYRAKRGIDRQPAIGVVVQALIEPVAAGVLFTRDPLTGANERVIEAAWGLGEAVVSGLVTPDCYRLDARGSLMARVLGCKDVKIWFDEDGGTSEVPVSPDLQEAPCLAFEDLERLHALAECCVAVWGTDLDLEWALGASGDVFLLQSRPITTFRNARA